MNHDVSFSAELALPEPLKLGTRGSSLARWQVDAVAAALGQRGISVEIVLIETTGDRQRDPIVYMGAQGVFTREIQRCLLDGTIDLAVHSLKDLPTEPVPGLRLAATLPRGPVRDAFLSFHRDTLEELPKGAVIGTGSLRRRTQIQNRYGNRFELRDIRGNVETRIEKLRRGEYDALILAEAGLRRLGLEPYIRSLLEPTLFMPAVGQGAIGLEIRENDHRTAERIAPIGDRNTFAAVTAERAMLHTLEGGCIAPIAALGRITMCDDSPRLFLQGRILSPDGKTMLEAEDHDVPDQAETLGYRLAQTLLQNGADRIVEQIRSLRAQ